MSYEPTPTAAPPTGVYNIVPRHERRARVDDVRGTFDGTVGAYVPPEWTWDAECTQPGVDPAVFYPKKGPGKAQAAALALCGRCEVQETCLDDALAFESGAVGGEDVRPEVHGIRGGKTAVERRALVSQIRARRAAARSTGVALEQPGEGAS